MKILVFTTDIPPLPGLPTSGTALRTFGLAQGLKAHGHEVVLSAPRDAIQGLKQRTDIASLPAPLQEEIRSFEENCFDSFNQPDVIAASKPDVILCGHWPAFASRVRPRQPVVVDLAGPHMLERHYQKAPGQEGALLAKLAVLGSADYFIVSGPSQRLYFFSYMLRAAINDPDRRTVNITMPLSPELPERPPQASESFPRFLFGGVFLPWQNPNVALYQLNETLNARQSGSLTLIGGKHPNYDIDEGTYGTVFQDLQKNPRVTVKPMLPFDQFTEQLSNADVALDVMQWNLERQLAMTIRSTTYLWAGLPVIYNDFADLGGIIKQYDAGWLADPSKPEQLDAIFEEIYASPELVAKKSRNAQTLAREVFSWDRAVEPLLEMLGSKSETRAHQTDIIVDCPELADFPVYGRKSFQQFFVCRVPGLNKIECKLATHFRKNRKPLRARVYRFEDPSWERRIPNASARKSLIHEQEFSAEDIRDSEWLLIDFTPVQNSDGHVFMLELDSQSAGTIDETVSPWVAKASPYPLVGVLYDGKRINQSGMCLRTTCSSQSNTSANR